MRITPRQSILVVFGEFFWDANWTAASNWADMNMQNVERLHCLPIRPVADKKPINTFKPDSAKFKIDKFSKLANWVKVKNKKNSTNS